MPITQRAPNTIHLGGPCTVIDSFVAIEAITPGMLLEPHNNGGAFNWGVHDSADTVVFPIVALDRPELNKGVDDAYAAGDLVAAGHLTGGSTWWAIVPSGQNIAIAGLLQSNGDGKLKAHGTGTAIAYALEGTGGAVATDTRIRVGVIGI